MRILTLALTMTITWLMLIAPPSWAASESSQFNSTKPLEIQRITPSGRDVPAGQQVVFQFNQPVVPVGKMERDAAEIPITITPALNCQWRWLNTSALACQLNRKDALKPATRYRILVQPGITTEQGHTLEKPQQHTFITQRPQVSYIDFQRWLAPTTPLVKVNFNVPVLQKSVVNSLYFSSPNGKDVLLQADLPKNRPQQQREYSENLSSVWLLQPKTALPGAAEVTLQVKPGLVTPLGPERGVGNRAIVSLYTFPEFKFIGIRCNSLQDNELTITPEDPDYKQKRCNPLGGVSMVFSSPVLSSVLSQGIKVSPDLAGGRTDYNPWTRVRDYSRLRNRRDSGSEYTNWLPENLKADDLYYLQAEADAITDEFGRPLVKSIDLRFLTDDRKPNYRLEHNISVLEAGVDSDVPLYVTNLEQVQLEYTVLDGRNWSEPLTHQLQLPTVKNVSYRIPLEIRKLMPETSIVLQGRFTTVPHIPNRWSGDAWFFSQVTPWHVQAKVGHYNTLVWVTEFATGQPLANAHVGILSAGYRPSVAISEQLATATTDANGLALLPGTVELDPELDKSYVYNRKVARFVIRVSDETNTAAVLPLDSDFRVNMHDIGTDYTMYPVVEPKHGHIKAWGTTAQGVYKVSDTVQFKIYVRNQANLGLEPAPREKYSLSVSDPTGKQVYTLEDIRLSEFGAVDGEFTIPKTAAVGWYNFTLKADFTDKTWRALKVLVSDFTPAAFRVSTVLNGELFRAGEPVAVTTHANLHAGGPYTDAKTRVTAMLKQTALPTTHPQAQGFEFDVLQKNVYDDTVYQAESRVDDKGQLLSDFVLAESKVLYGRLTVESAVQDDRGKNIAGTATAQYAGRDRYVGLKTTRWLLKAKQASEFQVLVVDEFGNPATGTPVTVNLERRDTKASRVKSAGNAYTTQYTHEWVTTGEQCKLVSQTTALRCDLTPPQAGSYRITAVIQDTQQRFHQTQVWQWATGSDWVLWETRPGHGLDITPEQASYKVGDTARYMIKNPYPGAKALVTIERLGVLKSWVTTLENSIEVLEVPIEADFEPGFYLSVTVMSPRVDKPLDANAVDLGKPALRMGYAKTLVKDPYKQLVVEIKPNKSLYKPREEVTIALQAKPVRPELPVDEPIELAVAVLDEAVFDLIQQGRDYFDPYQGFYTLTDMDVLNYSLLMRLVGRQKFEKKGADQGGDGGMGPTLRSLFKFVSYWNPSVLTDSQGYAQINFTVPDNLTGWRVLVMAATPTDRLGLSDANFKVNQPIELRPVLPNQLLSGDQFHAGFSVMNRTDTQQNIAVLLKAEGAVVADSTMQVVTATPYKRQTVWLPLQTTTAGDITLTAEATTEQEQDALQTTLAVWPRRTSVSAATYGTTDGQQVSEAVAFPTDIHTDTGGLQVLLSPTIIGGIDGAFEYMRDYPYICWEQKLTKGVMASHYLNLQAYISQQIKWTDAEDFTPRTLTLAADYQAPNGGMAYFIPTEQRVSPYLSAYTAQAFNWLRDSGYDLPETVENQLHDYLLNLLRKDELPDFYSKGMSSTVRAVALAALAPHQRITRADILRYQPHVKFMSLFGKAHFLKAALALPHMEKSSISTAQTILNHGEQTSGKFVFQEQLDGAYKHMLSSSLRTQCAVLSALVQYDDKLGAASEVGDVPSKLVRTITQARKNRGHWENTQENMFCMNALTEYARIYEIDVPDMEVTTQLDAEPMLLTDGGTMAEFEGYQSDAQTFIYPLQATDPGRQATVNIERIGVGRLYYTVRMQYAPTEVNAKRINAGFEVRREYHVEREGQWVLLDSPLAIYTGELVRVDLYVSLPGARYFVVVDDAVPGGLEPVNRDLATTSQIDADKANTAAQYAATSYWRTHDSWRYYGRSFWSFYHQELRHHAVRFYADYLPAGNYHLSYTAQAIAPGEFSVMPVHVEEMYEPEVFGKGLPATLVVTRAVE